MSTKVLSGVYSAGYTLSGAYSTIDLTGAAQIGGTGIVADVVATIGNAGEILAAAGAAGTAAYKDGGSGQYAVQMKAGGSLTNTSTIVAGQGGVGYDDAYGGQGGEGVWFGAAGTITNHGLIAGGAGFGPATYQTNANEAFGGSGGLGIRLSGGGTLVNSAGATLAGGAGAAGGSGYFSGGQGGWGGNGVYAKLPTTIVNHGLIQGGAAGAGGGAGALDGAGGPGGQGGQAINLVEGGAIINTGAIIGGAAGAGGASPGTQGDVGHQGDGISMNQGRLSNGVAIGASALIEGSYGLRVYGPGSTITNFGTIEGTFGNAVAFEGVNGVLRVEPGCAFIGAVDGGGGVLELAAGTGILTGLLSPAGDVTVSGSMAPTAFDNFNTVKIDQAGKFACAGGMIGAGQQLIDVGTLTDSATLAIAGNLSVSGGMAGAGALLVNGGHTKFNVGAHLTIAHVTLAGAPTSVGVGTNLSYGGVWTQSAGTTAIGNGDRLSLTGTGNSFAGTISGAGVLAFVGGTDMLTSTKLSVAKTVIDNATVTLSGTIANAGAVTAATPDLIIAAGGATLTGGGALNLTNLASNKIVGASAGATLTNINNRITGGGALGGGQMQLVNQSAGMILGDSATPLTIDVGVSTDVANAGLIEAVAGGAVVVKSGVANTGVLFAAGGTLIFDDVVFGSGTGKISGGRLSFAAAFSENVAFTGSTGVLELAQSQGYGGTVSGFSKAGTTSLDLDDIAFNAGGTSASFLGDAAGGTLTVSDGTHTAKITLAGNYIASTFRVSSDGHGGTIVVDPAKAPSESAGSVPRFIAAAASLVAAAAPSIEPAHAARDLICLGLFVSRL